MLKDLLENKQFIYAALIVVLIILLSALSALAYDYGFFSYTVGDIARDDITLESDVLDNEKTKVLRQAAVDSVEALEYVDITIQINVRKDLEYFFETLKETKSFHANDAEILKNVYFGIERNNKYLLDEEELKYLAVVDDDRLTVFKNTVMDTISEFLSSGINSDTFQKKVDQASEFIDSQDDLNQLEVSMGKKIVSKSLVVNQFEDVEKTKKARNTALASVPDVIVSKGTVIVKEGDSITEDVLLLMEEGGMILEGKSVYYGIIFVVFITTLMWFVLGKVLIYKFSIKDLRQLFIYQVIFSGLYIISLYIPSDMNGLLMISLLSILLTLIGNPMVGFIYGLVMLIALSFVKSIGPVYIMMYVGHLIIIALSVNRYSQRRQLMVAGGVLAAFGALFLASYNLVIGQSFQMYYESLIVVLSNGVLSAILALGVLPVIEIVFHVLTPIKLMELTNPNQPLLKRMLVEAPGTYHHSIIVGNLAETAAHAIGCDYMLARVGAHYHDIGKLQRPYYFKENQLGDENIHDDLEPMISAGIIKSHVSHGEHLAKKHKLPKEIINIINEHHGTTMIKYFYHKAIQSAEEDESVGVSKFTYDGPTPRSKESAVVMLADSVEAAVRSLDDHSDESILKMVRSVFKQKMDDGQLNYCDLTMRDLEEIQRAFIKVLSGIFHDRVKYPKEEDDK